MIWASFTLQFRYDFFGLDHMKKSECCQKKKEEKFFSAELDPTRGFNAGVTPQEVFNAFFSGEGLGQNVYMAMAAGAPSSIYQRYYQYAQVRAHQNFWSIFSHISDL